MQNSRRNLNLSFFCGMIALFWIILLAPAQVVPPGVPIPNTAIPARTPAIPAIAKSATTNQTAPQLKYEEAKLEMILKDYSEATKRTLLLDPKLPAPAKGITLRNEGELTMDEYLQAIETVLAMNGIGLVKVGDKFLKVVPIDSVRQEGMGIRDFDESTTLKDTDELVSQMIQLKNIDVAEASKLIDTLKFHHPYGKIHAFERTNCILLTDTGANVSRILDVLKYVDQPIESREEPKVVAIRHAKASLIKQKLEEIIQESQKDQSTIPRTKDRGSPGVVTGTPSTPTYTPPIAPPGVIRPTVAAGKTDAVASTAESVLARIMDEAERGIIRGKVKIVADDRTNVLIIITRPENMQFFDKIVKVLDVPTEPDVMVKVMRLEFADAEQVATMLNTLIGAQQQQKESGKPGVAGKVDAATGKETRSAALDEFAKQQSEALSRVAGGEGLKSKMGELSAQNIKILADKRINSLIIMASRLDMGTIEEIIKEMDMSVSQVLIEVLILDVNLSNEIQTGIDWIQRSLVAYNQNSDGSRKPLVGFAGGGGGGGQTASLSDLTKPFSPGAGLTYYLTYYGLNADIVARMSAKDGRSRVLSSPIILTTDNKKATLDVTTEKYFYKGQNYVSTGIGSYNPVDNVDMKSVGIKLSVTPHINLKRNVYMDISQEISNADNKQAIGKDGVLWPVMQQNKFEASVSVRSGMTIVLGGLANENKSINHSKIPVLGDLPLLGLLFGSSEKNKTRHEILVFLTPYVMDSPDEIEADALRRQAALGTDGNWSRGWSNSNMGQPTKEEIREEEKRERELEKNARSAVKKLESEAKNRKKMADVQSPDIENMSEVEKIPVNPTLNVSGNTIPGMPMTSNLDPAIADFIKRNDKKFEKNLKQIDMRIQKEILDKKIENNP